jgi:hypothetical protein
MTDKYKIELLDSIKDIDADMNIDVISIIDKGISIRIRKKAILQDILFLIFALALFGALMAFTIIKGPLLIIFLEVFSIVATPFALIPISKALLKEVR